MNWKVILALIIVAVVLYLVKNKRQTQTNTSTEPKGKDDIEVVSVANMPPVVVMPASNLGNTSHTVTVVPVFMQTSTPVQNVVDNSLIHIM